MVSNCLAFLPLCLARSSATCMPFGCTPPLLLMLFASEAFVHPLAAWFMCDPKFVNPEAWPLLTRQLRQLVHRHWLACACSLATPQCPGRHVLRSQWEHQVPQNTMRGHCLEKVPAPTSRLLGATECHAQGQCACMVLGSTTCFWTCAKTQLAMWPARQAAGPQWPTPECSTQQVVMATAAAP